MATKKKKTKAAPQQDRSFTQEPRTKLDIRVSEDLDARVEALSAKIGTTKNSIVAMATATYVAAMERVIDGKERLTPVEIKQLVEVGLTEMFGHVG